MTTTYYYRGLVERPTKRGYVWREGYSAGDERPQYPWMTKKECQQDAKRQGKKARFVDSLTPVQ